VRSMETVIHDSMIPYAEYVIMDRALPRVEDGLKPVQRRILYTMHEQAMWPDRPHRKCARIVGDCLGKYHPHGDSSVYDALVRMAQDFAMRHTLVDGHGNFGSIDGDAAAAMRYTEARLTPLSLELLRDLDKDTVPFSLNYDDSLKEPDVLPGRFPNLLVNGASGIAVGLATNIPPHNLGEVIDGVIAQLDNPDITVKELMRHVKGPDFPTGGVMLDSDEIEKAYETGRGRVVVRAACHIEKAAAGKKLIVITQVPYQVNKANLLERIVKLSEQKKAILSGIAAIRDESDRSGIRAVIEIRKDADAEKILHFLYKYTPLQTTFGVNMVAIAQGKPQLMGLKAINRHYIEHQKMVVTRRIRYDLEKARAREHILQGLMIALAHIDEVIRIIRGSDTPATAKVRLMERFGLSDIQAQAILDMRLQRLTALQIDELKKEYEQIQKLIAQLEAILKSERRLLALIKKELLEIRGKYAGARRTQFVSADGVVEVSEADFAVVEDTVVSLTAGGYIKRVSPKLYQRGARNGDDIKESEIVRFILETRTDRRLMLVTSRGMCHVLEVSALPDAKGKERGVLASTACGGFDDGEQVVSVMPAPDKDTDGEIILFTKNGMVKRSALADYVVRNRKFAGISLKKGDEVLSAELLQPDATLLSISANAMSIHTDPSTVPTTGRATGGVKNMALDDGDQVIFAGQIRMEGEVVVFTDRGYAKRILCVDFDKQNRNGKGARIFDLKGACGKKLAAVFYVTDPYELVLVQKKSGQTRLNTEAIPIQGRVAKGSPIVLAMSGDEVTGVFRPVY
ncbi:MAG: DNA gyrase subunit A, partial [Christensenellales bacterium]